MILDFDTEGGVEFVNDFNKIMSSAAEGSHINIVKLMLELGADDYFNTIKSAAYNGHINILNS